jgi:hypothetical protein
LLSQSDATQQIAQPRIVSPWFACTITAATLKQIAAAEAIEKKLIQFMNTSTAGSIEFHHEDEKSRQSGRR